MAFKNPNQMADAMLKVEEQVKPQVANVNNEDAKNDDKFGVPLYEGFKNYDDEFKGRMLGRLGSDLNYYLGHGNYQKRNLWNTGGEPEETVELMKGLWDSIKEKPTWITKKDIEDYSTKLAQPVVYNEKYHGFLKDQLKTPESIAFQREMYPREENKRYNELLDIFEKMMNEGKK